MGLQVGERKLCQATTIDHKLLARDKSRFPTRQPENGVSDILGSTESTNGMKRFDRLIDDLSIGISRQQLLVEGRVDPTGGNSVTADTQWAVLERRIVSKSRYRGL